MKKIINSIFIVGIEKYFTVFFYGLCVFVLCLITQGVILTLANIFFLPLILLSCFISLIFALIFLKKTQKNIQVMQKITLPMIIFTLIIVGIIIFFPHDTIGGRDESIFANLAIHLTNNHSLNLPQHLTNLTSNYAEGVRGRLPAYTVWLGITYILVGINGLFRSNVILIMLGLFSFFLTASYLSNKKIAFLCSILLGSAMPFLWFMRETMTENLFFFVLWFSILSLITYIKSKNLLFLVVVLLCSWILSLTRIEGLFIQITLSISMIIFSMRTNNKSVTFIIISCVILTVSSLLIFKMFGFSSYLKESVEGARFNLNKDISFIVSNTNPTKLLDMSPRKPEEALLYNKMVEFVVVMLAKYNYAVIFFATILVSIVSFSKQKYKYSKKFYLLILFVILPEFSKIISPSVTLDQPWFYRRYLYALLPFGYLSFVLLLSCVNKRILISVVTLIFTINILFSSNTLFLKNNWTLADRLEYLSKDISNNDLVIIRNFTLGYYYPGSYLIIQKGIRSVFASEIKPSMMNTEKKTFNGVPYENIFLLSTNKNENYPNFVINHRKNIDLSYVQLEPLCRLNEIGLLEKYKNSYTINLIPYNLAISYCGEINNTIKKHIETLYLFELSKN